MSNKASLDAWDGADGERWAAEADRYDRMSRRFADAILDAASPAPGERVLDIGCGNGALTLAIAPTVGIEGHVTGVDISTPMLAVAQQRADAVAVDNVSWRRADAQTADLGEGAFDLVVSRFGVMFFEDPHAAFANLARSLRTGGRIVFTCWRDLLANDWIMVPAAAALLHVPMPELGDEGGRGPFSLADAEHVQRLLGGAGFADVHVAQLDLPVTMGLDVDDAIDFMRGGDMASILFVGVDDELVQRAWEEIRSTLAAGVGEGAVELNGSVWLVDARRDDTPLVNEC